MSDTPHALKERCSFSEGIFVASLSTIVSSVGLFSAKVRGGSNPFGEVAVRVSSERSLDVSRGSGVSEARGFRWEVPELASPPDSPGIVFSDNDLYCRFDPYEWGLPR